MTTLDESGIQAAIHNHRHFMQANPVMIPNVFYFYWESDVLMITRSRCIHEYEIKLTMSDFRADFKKTYRHFCMKERTAKYPAHFWYVCPPDVIPVDEVPEYAGLAYVVPYHGIYALDFPYTLSKIKKAPRLKGDKRVADDELFTLLAKQSWRHWSQQSRTVADRLRQEELP
jgi:hypothetical protein